MILAMKIKQLRRLSGLTQQELADKLSISRSTLAGYEAENKQPSYQVLVQIANCFDVTTDYLLDAGLFEEKTYNLLVIYRDVILKKLFDGDLITKSLFKQLHCCNIDKCIMFFSTIISDVSGGVDGIKFCYTPYLGTIGKSMYETLTSVQKEQFKYSTLEELPNSREQLEMLNKIEDLSPEQQSKIREYINMSYEIEKASAVAATETGKYLDNQGKSLA